MTYANSGRGSSGDVLPTTRHGRDVREVRHKPFVVCGNHCTASCCWCACCASQQSLDSGSCTSSTWDTLNLRTLCGCSCLHWLSRSRFCLERCVRAPYASSPRRRSARMLCMSFRARRARRGLAQSRGHYALSSTLATCVLMALAQALCVPYKGKATFINKSALAPFP